MNYAGSTLERAIKKTLKSNYSKVKKLWTISPYDWGNVLTTQNEIIKVGRHCTLLVLIKMGPKNYFYLIFYSTDSGKKSKLIPAKGLPQKVITTYKDGTQSYSNSTRRELQ